MKKIWMLTALGLMALAPAGWAIPSAITYQGTLKTKTSGPVTGPTQMTFTITDKLGVQAYSIAIPTMVAVQNGLFAVQLDFQLTPPYTWESITPYLKINVGGVDLAPPEPINAILYATISGTVVNGSISPAKVSPGFGLVPSGMIGIFENNCPAGWTIFTALQGKYPAGADNSSDFTLGVSTGSLTHRHSFQTADDGTHHHDVLTTTRGSSQNYGTPGGAPAGMYLEDVANQPLERASPHTHVTENDGIHHHAGVTDRTSSLPPTLPVIFCQKQ